ARLGMHSIAVVSPAGLSGPVSFWVGDHSVLLDAASPNRAADTARAVTLPVAVHGSISENGQLNYYAFEIARQQTVAFEMLALQGPNFDPQLALYEPGGSFLDPKRSKRLLFHEEVTQGSMPAGRRVTYHFSKPGRYVVNIGNPFGQGGAGSAYLLRITPSEPPAGADDVLGWARVRLQELRARSVDAPATDVVLVREREPNDQVGQAHLFTFPAVIEG